MATLVQRDKACAVNPLKMSQPIGAALAFMGLRGAMPLLHGAQGCTSFGLVLFVRHFKEAIPLQTTAMSEVATVLGGPSNLEQAILTIRNRAKPEIIGICSTGVTETSGEDVEGSLRAIRQAHPELAGFPLVFVATPDFKDSLQTGWGKAVHRMVEALVPQGPAPVAMSAEPRINVLPGCHLTPGDIEELRTILEDFGFQPLFLPDLGGSLDGHIPDDFTPTTIGGIGVEDIARMGNAVLTLAVGEQMRPAAQALESRTGVPFDLFPGMCGLEPNDRLMTVLSRVSGRPVPLKYRRQRGQLVDAMLDAHFHIGGRRLAIGAEPDLLYDVGTMLQGMGVSIEAAVTTGPSPALDALPASEVVVGDLWDLEQMAAERGCDLLITHSHGRQAASRLGIPFFRLGLPMFDRLGAGHLVTVGYRGTRDLIFAIANLLIADHEENHQPTPDSWRRRDDEEPRHEDRFCDPGSAAGGCAFRMGEEHRHL